MELRGRRERGVFIRERDSRARDALLVAGALLLLVAAEVLILAYVYLPQRRNEVLRRAQSELSAIIADRRSATTAWVQERTADAQVAAHSLAILSASGGLVPSLRQSEAMLDEFVDHYHYDAVFVLDDHEQVVLQRGAAGPPGTCVTDFARRALTHPEMLVDFCQGTGQKPHVLSTATFSLDSRQPSSRGVVVFVADPARYLYPMLSAWTISKETGELVLGRIEGGIGVVLTPMRLNTAPPMSFRVPVQATIVEQARRAGTGVGLRYLDYRKVPVIGEVHPIAGTPWLLIGKMDESEALAPAWDETVRLGTLVTLGLCIVASGAFSVLRSRRVRELRAAEDQYRRLFENSMEAISVHQVIFDAAGKPVDQQFIGGNPALERITGVPIAGQIGTRSAWPDLTWPAEVIEDCYRVATTGEPIRYERFNPSVNRWFDATVFSPRRGQFVIVFSDITERKRNEGLLRALSESSLVGVFSHEGHAFTYANEAATAIFGYTPQEAIGTDPLTVIVPEDEPFMAEQMRRRLSGEEPGGSYEFRVRCKDGSIRCVRLYVTRVEIEGHPLVIGNVLDVTEQRTTEQALRESEERFRTIVETSYQGISWCDADFRLTYVNRRLSDILGYTEEQLIGRRISDFVDPEETLDAERESETHRKGMVSQYERTYVRADGTRVVCAVSAVPFQNERGEFSGSLAMLTDVTERVRTDQQVRRLARAVSQLREGIVITDSNGIIEYVNPAYERMTGYANNELMGRHCSFVQSDDQPSLLVDEIWQTINNGASWEGSLRSVRKSGTVLDEEATISPVLDANGRIMNVVAARRDVTRERSLLAQLHQAQKMEAVGTLAGGVAHDFNNLLMGMGMMLEVAARSSDVPEHLATTFVELEKQVRRGAALTKQLLLFSRKEVAKPERIDLNAVVRDASKLLRRLVRENISFSIDLAEEPLPVTADSTQIEQALVNLVVNAADAMASGGTLRVSTGSDSGDCWVHVDDSGHGIPLEIRDRVFEPFFTTKGRDRGTGLGLSVVHGIVLEHGGTVSFEDRPEGGTRFRISLPRAPNDGMSVASTSSAIRPPIQNGKGERILVVEDEAAVREGLVSMLQFLGYRPLGVSSAEEALDLPADSEFDLVLSDLVLPGLAGSELSQRLAERWPGMKSILMSGYSDDDEIRRNAAEGFLLLLQKPFEISVLAEALRSAFDTGSAP